jgi:hypothetical protein
VASLLRSYAHYFSTAPRAELAAGLTLKDIDEYRTKRLGETTRFAGLEMIGSTLRNLPKRWSYMRPFMWIR